MMILKDTLLEYKCGQCRKRHSIVCSIIELRRSMANINAKKSNRIVLPVLTARDVEKYFQDIETSFDLGK